jgi:hypothetical protein
LRCGALSGRPCLVSTNWAYNAVLGHCGETRFVLWRNVFGEDRWKGWRAPAGTERGYTQDLLLPFDSYDTRANAAWAWAWTRAHPGEALRSSVRHVWDLLASRPFPSAEDPRWAAFARFGQWFFWIFVLAPAALGLAQRRPGLAEALLLLPLVGLAAAAFLTIGESRYRVPYDGLLIVLAARTYLEALGPMVPRGGPRS